MSPHTFFVRLLTAILLATGVSLGSEPGLVSTMGVMAASPDIGGITVVPAPDIPGKFYTEDLAPSQVFEIIRPEMGPISVGRLAASCTCLSVSMEKRDFAQGERAILEVRNVKATPPEGATYMVFAQLNHPVSQALQFEVFVKSGGSAPAPSGRTVSPAEPARIIRQPAPSRPVQRQPGRELQSQPMPPPRRYEDIVPYPPRPKQ